MLILKKLTNIINIIKFGKIILLWIVSNVFIDDIFLLFLVVYFLIFFMYDNEFVVLIFIERIEIWFSFFLNIVDWKLFFILMVGMYKIWNFIIDIFVVFIIVIVLWFVNIRIRINLNLYIVI